MGRQLRGGGVFQAERSASSKAKARKQHECVGDTAADLAVAKSVRRGVTRSELGNWG